MPAAHPSTLNSFPTTTDGGEPIIHSNNVSCRGKGLQAVSEVVITERGQSFVGNRGLHRQSVTMFPSLSEGRFTTPNNN
jgi:hypothetical protein